MVFTGVQQKMPTFLVVFLLQGINSNMRNVIYKLINRRKEKLGESPCYYIGSKTNYVPGTYWGSSRNPILINELTAELSNFEMEILEEVPDNKNLIETEITHQLTLNVVKDKKYYNLRLAGKNFATTGYKYYYHPTTLVRGFFPPNKVPTGWMLGKGPDSTKRKKIIKTGLKKGDPKLNKLISERTKANTPRGVNHTETRVWILQDPTNKIHKVVGLHEFCKDHTLAATSLQYSINTNKPIKKGKSKGWRLLSKE